MLRNYLVTALRNFARHRLYSFINIAGLAVGLACAIFIMLFLADELSYDRWIPHADNLYRVDLGLTIPRQGEQFYAQTSFTLAPAMAAQIPEVTAFTRIVTQTVTLKAQGRLFAEPVDVVDPQFFKVIALPLAEGDPTRVFAEPNSIVISQMEATKLFGARSALGKTITVNGTHPMVVTGILRDLPHNTQFDFKVLFPNTSKADPMEQYYKQHWFSIGTWSYVRLAPASLPSRAIDAANAIIDHNVNAKKEMGINVPGSSIMHVHLTPFTAVHLDSLHEGAIKPAGSRTEIYGFAAIALLLLLIAGFNFTNLATARAMMRAREVSLRKVVGARRGQLVAQFIAESVLTTLVALLLALSVVELLTPAFDSFLRRPISLHLFADWRLVLSIVGVATLTGLLAGLYPAFILSRFRPATTLRANQSGASGSSRLRTVLVVVQFAISIGLGTAAAVVFAQIRYSQSLDLGFNHSHVVVIANVDDIPKTAREDFVRALDAEPSIAAAALSEGTPFEGNVNLDMARVPGSPEQISIRRWAIMPAYLSLYGIRPVAGRTLSRDRAQDFTDSGNNAAVNILVNEVAARRFGFTPQGAIGKTIYWDKHPATIVGVLDHMRIDGPPDGPEPVIVYCTKQKLDEISVRTRAGRTEEAVAAIDRDWQRFAPNAAIQRHFLDDLFDGIFQEDRQRGHMFAVFVGVAIFIACLGLFGLAAFTAGRRTREIGVRKVFGARTSDVVRLMLWQFSIPVLLANAIAWPVAWYYLHSWLESYAYRITLSAFYFIAAGVAALAIAWATVIGHSLAVARSNPIHALRYE